MRCAYSISGKMEKIGGFDTYVTKPQKDYPKDKAVLLLPDIFGIQFKNCKVRRISLI